MEPKELEDLIRSVVERVVSGGDVDESAAPAAPQAACGCALGACGCTPTRSSASGGDATGSAADSPAQVTVAVGADHGGFPLKERLRDHLYQQGYRVIDCGTDSTESVDYPVFAEAVAEAVADGRARFGVIVDGAGIGSAMMANKIPGVRAALCYDLSTASNAREHNDANVLTLGAGLIGPALATQILDTFLATRCTEERHLRRVAMIDARDGARSGAR